MAKPAPVQQLLGYTTSARIGESLAARVKDPLWFLARQWQTGEFEAENGGRPAVISITSREIRIDRLTRGRVTEDVSPETPLEFAVEREANDRTSAVWNSESLESGFEMSGGGVQLVAREYTGRQLDWYHFDFDPKSDLSGGATSAVETRVVASTLPIRGAPDPRWWRFEEGDAYFDDPKDPEPNILSTLLPEFALIDVNNWFMVPLLQTAGTVREIREVVVVDSFGVTTSIAPIEASEKWAMFTLATVGTGPRLAATSSAFLYVPNVAIEVLDNDEVEEVVFTRDEDANLVWACERLVEHETRPGTFVRRRNGDGRGLPVKRPSPDPADYRLVSDVPAYWIPYVPRVTRADGSIHLRRGRTIESSTPAKPQYQSVIVKESWKLEEAGIPRTGVRVRRIHRFARGSDGSAFFWVGRDKSPAPRMGSPELKFDFLE